MKEIRFESIAVRCNHNMRDPSLAQFGIAPVTAFGLHAELLSGVIQNALAEYEILFYFRIDRRIPENFAHRTRAHVERALLKPL